MSRCLPFPPPGYEKKAMNGDLGYLAEEEKQKAKQERKEKRKEKRKNKDKDKKDEEGKREKKHKDNKHKNDKGKDRDSSRSTETIGQDISNAMNKEKDRQNGCEEKEADCTKVAEQDRLKNGLEHSGDLRDNLWEKDKPRNKDRGRGNGTEINHIQKKRKEIEMDGSSHGLGVWTHLPVLTDNDKQSSKLLRTALAEDVHTKATKQLNGLPQSALAEEVDDEIWKQSSKLPQTAYAEKVHRENDKRSHKPPEIALSEDCQTDKRDNKLLRTALIGNVHTKAAKQLDKFPLTASFAEGVHAKYGKWSNKLPHSQSPCVEKVHGKNGMYSHKIPQTALVEDNQINKQPNKFLETAIAEDVHTKPVKRLNKLPEPAHVEGLHAQTGKWSNKLSPPPFLEKVHRENVKCSQKLPQTTLAEDLQMNKNKDKWHNKLPRTTLVDDVHTKPAKQLNKLPQTALADESHGEIGKRSNKFHGQSFTEKVHRVNGKCSDKLSQTALVEDLQTQKSDKLFKTALAENVHTKQAKQLNKPPQNVFVREDIEIGQRFNKLHQSAFVEKSHKSPQTAVVDLQTENGKCSNEIACTSSQDSHREDEKLFDKLPQIAHLGNACSENRKQSDKLARTEHFESVHTKNGRKVHEANHAAIESIPRKRRIQEASDIDIDKCLVSTSCDPSFSSRSNEDNGMADCAASSDFVRLLHSNTVADDVPMDIQSPDLTDIYRVPQMQGWSDVDEQAWLFHGNHTERKSRAMNDEQRPTVWAQALYMESTVTYALPFVLPF